MDYSELLEKCKLLQNKNDVLRAEYDSDSEETNELELEELVDEELVSLNLKQIVLKAHEKK